MAALKFSGVARYAFSRIFGSGIVSISITVLMFIALYWYWQWWLLFLLGLAQTLGMLITFGPILRWKFNPWFLLTLLVALIAWGFYIAYSSYSFWTKLLQVFLAGFPVWVFYKLMDLSPWFYTKMLGSDHFDWHRWTAKPRIWPYIRWERIFKLLEKKGFKSSIQYSVSFCLNLPTQRTWAFSKKLQELSFRYWVNFSEEINLSFSDSVNEKKYPLYNLNLEAFLVYVKDTQAMPAWLEQAKKEPEQLGLLFNFFQHFNELLSQYIADPYLIYDDYFLEEEKSEILINLYIDEIAAVADEALIEEMETARGLYMLSMGLAAQMNSLPEGSSEEPFEE